MVVLMSQDNKRRRESNQSHHFLKPEAKTSTSRQRQIIPPILLSFPTGYRNLP